LTGLFFKYYQELTIYLLLVDFGVILTVKSTEKVERNIFAAHPTTKAQKP
jgi:hypothetical protein